MQCVNLHVYIVYILSGLGTRLCVALTQLSSQVALSKLSSGLSQLYCKGHSESGYNMWCVYMLCAWIDGQLT